MDNTFTDIPMSWDELEDVQEPSGLVAVADALVLCLRRYGRVDMPYICEMTGADIHTVIASLQGTVYQDPEK